MSAVLRIEGLPPEPLDAAAQFHSRWLPLVIEALAAGADDLTLIFSAADHTHEEWRRAAVQGLARRFAPQRVNALACDEAEPIAAAARYLAGAPGVTGQYLSLDGTGAGKVICIPQ